jgi:acetoin utilization transport system permease protein
LNFDIIGSDYDISQSYYVYPSFTKTMEYMKSLGANLESVINPDNIESITILKYKDESAQVVYGDKYNVETATTLTPEEFVFTEKEDIEKITSALLLERFINGTKYNLNINYNLEVRIQYKYAGNNSDSAYLWIDKLPEDIRNQIEK